MPSRRQQNARRWRRLEWDGADLVVPPAVQEPFEEPSPEPAPEPIEVQAEHVPTAETLVITAEVMPEPETRVQLVSNPEQKKKIRELGKEKQRMAKLNTDLHHELEKQAELNTLQHEALKKLKKEKENHQEEMKRLMDDASNVNEFDMWIIKQMSKWKAGTSNVTLTFHWPGKFGERNRYINTTIEEGRHNSWDNRSVEERETGFFQMRLGTWINLKDCYKYFIMDANNFWWKDFISVALTERISKLRFGLVEMDAWGKWCCEVVDAGKTPEEYGPEEFFSILCDEALTEKAETEGVKEEAMNGEALNYYMRKIDLKRTVGQKVCIDIDSSQEELLKWEKAKNSIIQL
jgi:hypothetical protein